MKVLADDSVAEVIDSAIVVRGEVKASPGLFRVLEFLAVAGGLKRIIRSLCWRWSVARFLLIVVVILVVVILESGRGC